jgi:integrase
MLVMAVQLVDLKTVGSRRVLHLSRPVVEMLERHPTRQEAEELVVGKRWNNEDELIFTSNIGTPLDPQAFGRTVPTICKDAGLGHCSIHELRHSCASLLIAMECDWRLLPSSWATPRSESPRTVSEVRRNSSATCIGV